MFPNLSDVNKSLLESLLPFLPELLLCVAIVMLLVFRLFKAMDRVHLGRIALVFTLLALGATVLQWFDLQGFDRNELKSTSSSQALEAFNNLVVYDRLTIFLRLFLLAFTALILWLTLLTGIPDAEDSADFSVLLHGAVLGMCFMASANHLLMIYLAIEMASLPSYALAGFLKGRRASSEAALKYVVYGGGAAGIMLYGISLLAGTYGTAYLPDLAHGIAGSLTAGG